MTKQAWLASLMLALSLSATALAQQAHDLYQQALSQENAAGDLDSAIALYRQTAQAAGADRALAARALARAAGAYEKLGRYAVAARVYADVIRTYPEQRAETRLAQDRLSVLRREGHAAPTGLQAGVADVSSAVGPFLERYCTRCHDASTRSGGLDLAALDQRNVSRTTAQWETVVRRLLARRDPPAGAERPGDAASRAVIARLQSALDAAHAASRPGNGGERVDDAELAARLARFIWNAEPDAALLEDAARGRLHDPTVLQRHVSRMLRDARSRSLIDRFFTGWLSLDRIRTARPDPQRFPDVDAGLLQAMATETQLFLQEQLRDDRDPIDLWTADFTYVNGPLARHYGLSGITGDEFRRIRWSDGRRGGLLGHAAILTASSMATRTSPTQRGRFVLSRFFGVDAPAPPANVPAMAETPPSGLTLRDRLRAHKSNPSCASCHAIFDPIGLALENFDAAGAWRALDGGSPIDATGTFVDGTRFDGPADLRAGLLRYREAYYTGLTQQLLAFALERRGKGGQVYDYEMPSVRAIVRAGAVSGYRWSVLLAGVAASAPFQMPHIVP